MADATWRTAEHGPLEALGRNLWQVEAVLPSMPIGRRMVISRLGDGRLVVHNAVACDSATMAAIEALGPISFLLVPGGFHRMDLPAFAARYPDCKVLAMPGSIGRARQRARVDGGAELLPKDAHTRWQPLDGVPAEGVLLHDTSDGTAAIFNDCLFNLPERPPGLRGLVLQAVGSTGGVKVTRIARTFLVSDRRAFVGHLERLAALDPVLVVPGHGELVRSDGGAALRKAAEAIR
jgi:hypothetical protein